MNWKHVRLIFQREISDQLRDRRTLFTITILPLLLYPLMGMLMMQIAQFGGERAVRIRIVGAENWPSEIPLLNDQHQLVELPRLERLSRLIEFELLPWPRHDSPHARQQLAQQARSAVMSDAVDAVLMVQPEFESLLQQRLTARAPGEREPAPTVETASEPPGFDEHHVPAASPAATVDSLGQAESDSSGQSESGGDDPGNPAGRADGLQLVANLARDQSKIAQQRMELVLDEWRSHWVASQLSAAGMNPRLIAPIQVAETDAAPTSARHAMLWSKLLPFVMLVWAVTGAFYPAIDLCAGEKERGTLETLLSSPARRKEIVWGKLLTISVFSIGSALLNMMSMHLTAGIIVKQLAAQGGGELAQALGPIPSHAFGWLVLLLLPMSAFFSALALAVAALAKSTKEGQYYLMPLLLVTLPLVALPMLPSLELNLGTSLVPVSGAVFLVRSLIEGRYSEALTYLPVVMLVTICCCSLAVRWAIRQFESESVMFRETDRWNLRLWMHQLWRDRGDTASPTEAVLCGVIILIGMFFAQFVAGSTIADWRSVVISTITVQIGMILTPCLLMAILLTRSFRRALRIHRAQPTHLVAAILIGIALHPTYLALSKGIGQVYALGDETAAMLAEFQAMVLAQPLWAVLLLLAALPAVCEELAFRGFIFGGLLRQQGALRAIVVSALFFGFTHTLLQQSIAASMMGLMLGLIAWRTGGVLCTILVHVINNTLSLSLAWCGANQVDLPISLQWVLTVEDGQWAYQDPWMTLSVFMTLALLVVLFRRSRETQRVVQAEMV